MSPTGSHASASLLPTDQQLVTLDLEGRRLLARIVASDESGRLSVVVFDVDPAARDRIERSDALVVEYVKVGLCRAELATLRVDDSLGPRTPLLVVHGRIGRVDSVQRRDNYRVRLALPIELLLLNGTLDRPEPADTQSWHAARSVNVSADGLCVETACGLYRGDVVSVRFHTELRALEADARVLGPRPAPETALRQYGMQLIQIPRADQQLLTALLRKEEQRGLAYRIER